MMEDGGPFRALFVFYSQFSIFHLRVHKFIRLRVLLPPEPLLLQPVLRAWNRVSGV